MSSPIVFADYLPDLRYWLRNDPILHPMHGGRVYFRLPRTTQAPMLRISQVGGGQQPDSEVPISDVQCIIEIWGMQDKDYEAVRQIRLGLEHICWAWVPGNLPNPTSNTRMHNARFNGGYDSPDPQTGWPRIICHTTFTVTAITPTIIG